MARASFDVEDIALEQAILRNAAWDAPPDPELGRAARPSRTAIELEGSERLAAADSAPPTTGPIARWLARHGASQFRRGLLDEAAATWARIPADDELAAQVRAWRALALAKRGEHAQALELAGDRLHLRGELLCALGRLDEGLALLRESTASDALTEWRALRTARWLRRAGNARDAAELLDARLEKAARFEIELREEAVHAWLEALSPEGALPHMARLRKDLPGLARALALDPRLAEAPGAEDLVAWARAWDVGALPPELRALDGDPRLAALGVWLVDPASAEELQKQIEKGPSAPLGVLPGPSMWEALAEAGQLRVVAQSLVRPGRTAYVDSPALWLHAEEEPEQLYLCLNGRIPVFLWPAAPMTLDGMAAALAPYRRSMVVDEPWPADMTCRRRLYLGPPEGLAVPSPYTGELEEMDFHTFGRVAVSSPFLEAHGWGSAHAEDPWAHFVDRGGLGAMIAMRDKAGMDEQRVPTETYRTRWSRSTFALEQHRSGWVADIRYRPSPHPGTARAIDERFGTAFGADLPLDVIGVLMHFHEARTVEALKASIHPDMPRDEWWRLHVIGALLHEDLALDAWLDELPEVFAPAAHSIAWTYGRLGFLLGQALRHRELTEPLQRGPFASGLVPPGREDENEDGEDEDDSGDRDGEEET